MATQTFGKYQLLKKLATGGMAEVWLARQVGIEGFQRLNVVKRILPHLADDPEFVKMFLNEAKIAARFNHPNIAQIYDLGETNGNFFIAMEFIHGEDLGRVMRKAWSTGQWIPQPLAIRIVAAACEGLYYAHTKADEQGRPLKVVHRDISPQNILLSFDGSVKVVDFGIAKAADQASLTKSGAIKGKFAYMAPEQAAGKPLDARSDIFAVGLVLYELITGVRPLKRDNEIATLQAALECDIPPPSSQCDCPKQLDQVVMRALAKAADDRYRDARQFQMELEEFLVAQRWVASSVQLSEMMGQLFQERLDEEARLGHPEPDSMDSISAGTPAAPAPPQRDRSPPTERGEPGWEAPPGKLEPAREQTRTHGTGARSMAKGSYRTDPGQRAPTAPPPDVPDWEAPPATEYDARRSAVREPTLIGRSRSVENVPAQDRSRGGARADATMIGRSRSDTKHPRRDSHSQVAAFDDRDRDPRYDDRDQDPRYDDRDDPRYDDRDDDPRYDDRRDEDESSRSQSGSRNPRTSSRSQASATNIRRRNTQDLPRDEDDRGYERAGAGDPEATRLPPPEREPTQAPREATQVAPRRSSRASVAAVPDVPVRRRLSRPDVPLTPEQKYGVAPDDDAVPQKARRRPEEEAAIARALAREQALARAKRIFLAALTVAVAIVLALFHKPILATLLSKPIDSGAIFLTVETNIPIQVFAKHHDGESAPGELTFIGDTPLRGAPGAHLQDTVVLINKERSAYREIEIAFGQPGDVKTISETFEDGFLKLKVTPKNVGKLWITREGKEVGQFTQSSPKLTLMEGTHELELNGPQLKEGRKFTVEVRRGETTEPEPIDLASLLN